MIRLLPNIEEENINAESERVSEEKWEGFMLQRLSQLYYEVVVNT